MQRSPASLDSLGRTMIVTDIDTRAKLKALARANQVPLSAYLRHIANQGGPGAILDIAAPATKKDLGELNYANMGTMAIVVTTLMAVILDFYKLHPDKAMKARLEHEFFNRMAKSNENTAMQPGMELNTA